MTATPPSSDAADPTSSRVSVVVVTWNSAGTIEALLEPLVDDAALELIVVDNDSADDTMAVVARRAPDAVRIRTGGNCGFAAGVDVGAEAATGDVLVLLNPDCIAEPAVVHHLADRVRAGSGIVAPRLIDEHGAVSRSTRRRPRLADQFVVAAGLHRIADRFDPDADGGASAAAGPVAAEVVSGACFATPLSLFRELGGLDQRFFLYGEEVDYMVRVADAGRRIEYDPTVSVVHLGGVSADQVSSGTADVLFESRVRWFDKHHGRLQAQLARLALAAWALRRRDRAAIRAMFRPMKQILTPTHPRPEPVRVDD